MTMIFIGHQSNGWRVSFNPIGNRMGLYFFKDGAIRRLSRLPILTGQYSLSMGRSIISSRDVVMSFIKKDPNTKLQPKPYKCYVYYRRWEQINEVLGPSVKYELNRWRASDRFKILYGLSYYGEKFLDLLDKYPSVARAVIDPHLEPRKMRALLNKDIDYILHKVWEQNKNPFTVGGIVDPNSHPSTEVALKIAAALPRMNSWSFPRFIGNKSDKELERILMLIDAFGGKLPSDIADTLVQVAWEVDTIELGNIINYITKHGLNMRRVPAVSAASGRYGAALFDAPASFIDSYDANEGVKKLGSDLQLPSVSVFGSLNYSGVSIRPAVSYIDAIKSCDGLERYGLRKALKRAYNNETSLLIVEFEEEDLWPDGKKESIAIRTWAEITRNFWVINSGHTLSKRRSDSASPVGKSFNLAMFELRDGMHPDACRDRFLEESGRIPVYDY